MNKIQTFAVCVRMSAIGDILMTSRALHLLSSRGVTPILLTAPAFKEVPACFPFLDHILLLSDSGKLTYLKRQASGEFEEFSEIPSTVVSNIVATFDLQSTSRSRRAVAKLKTQLAEKSRLFNSSFHKVKKRSLYRWRLVIKSRLKGQRPSAESLAQQSFAAHSVVVRQLEMIQRWLAASFATETKNLSPSLFTSPDPGTLFRSAALRDSLPFELPLKYCVLFAGASFPLKTWPLENCREFLTELEKANIKVALIGGPNEQEICEQIARLYRNVNTLAGKISLKETFLIIENATCVVTTDSFPAHVCDLLNKKAIVLFGATSPLFGFAPLADNIQVSYSGLGCSPCSRHGKGTCRFKNNACMKAHKGADIAARVKEYFNS